MNVSIDQKIRGNTCKIDFAQTLWFGVILCPKNRDMLGLFKYRLFLGKSAILPLSLPLIYSF